MSRNGDTPRNDEESEKDSEQPRHARAILSVLDTDTSIALACNGLTLTPPRLSEREGIDLIRKVHDMLLDRALFGLQMWLESP